VEQATGAPRICLGTDVFDGEAADLGRHEGGGWMGSSEVNRGWSFERVRGEEFGCCAACGPKGERLVAAAQRRTKKARFLRNAANKKKHRRVCGQGADERTNNRPN